MTRTEIIKKMELWFLLCTLFVFIANEVIFFLYYNILTSSAMNLFLEVTFTKKVVYKGLNYIIPGPKVLKS